MGTTGEKSTLTSLEHLEVVRYAIERADHRVPIIVGTGSNDTAHAINMSREAVSMGADALLVVTPYYNKATQNGLVNMYQTIADSVDKPLILYNVPSRTGVGIEPETYAKLADHPNIAGIKEANGDISKIVKTRALVGDKLAIYSGNDDQVVPILSMGGSGVISVLSNLMPKETSLMCHKFFEGDLEGAREMQLKYLPLINALFSEVNLRRAYVLRLLHSGRLKIVNDPTPGRNMAKAFYVEKPEADPPEEPGNSTYNICLHEFLYAAAGSDHILQPEELDDYVKAHPVECRPMVKALWRALSVRRFYIGNLKREEVNQVFGLKKYLEEFTLNNEHSLAEVQLWKEYLVYASLFGNAEQVCKDMQKVFPDFEKLSGIETSAIASDTVAMSASLAASAYTAAVYVRSYETPQERRSREAARAYAASSSSRSSGGGGSSSYRGGSGSAGGGGSGFR